MGFSIKNRLPPSRRPRTPPSPSPSRKKIKNIRNVRQGWGCHACRMCVCVCVCVCVCFGRVQHQWGRATTRPSKKGSFVGDAPEQSKSRCQESRKGLCRNPRGIFLNKVPGEFCGGFFGELIFSGLFPWERRRKKSTKKSRQNSNRNLGGSRPKSTLQGSGLDDMFEPFCSHNGLLG